jgi:hypothetical protein
MPKKKSTDSDNPSVIVSRVQREAMEGKRPKGEKEHSIIRSRVIHGDVAGVSETAPKAARKSARGKTSRSTRTRSRSTSTPDTSTEL